MQAFSITLSLPHEQQKSKLRRVTSRENNELRKHRAHWSWSLVLEAGRESSRRESSDIDEARRVSRQATANQSNRHMEPNPVVHKTQT